MRNLGLFLLILLYCASVTHAADFILGSQYQELTQGLPRQKIANQWVVKKTIRQFGVLGLEGKIEHGRTFDPDHSETKLQMNELFWQKSHENFLFSVGRKKVRWGVGYVESPTDIISPYDPQDMLYNIRGTNMVQFSNTIAENKQLDLYFLPKEDTAVAFRYYTYILPYDMALIGAIEEGGQRKFGGNMTRIFGEALELHADYLFELHDPDDSTNKLLVGGQWSPVSSINIVMEYINYSKAFNDYLFVRGLKKELFSDFQLEWIGLFALSDSGLRHRFAITYSPTPTIELYVQVYRTAGPALSEFRAFPEQGKNWFGAKWYF